MKTSHERVTKALDLLTNGLYPFVEQELKAIYKENWIRSARASFRKEREEMLPHGDVVRWDAHSVLTVMWDQWNSVFRHKLGHMERSMISELREFRNRWAHQAIFDFDDTYRILDSAHRLLKAVSATEAEQLAWDKDEMIREKIAEELDDQSRRNDFTKEKWMTTGIYIFCCTAIVFVLFYRMGSESWPVAVFTVFIFLFFVYQQFIAPFPKLGPHECKRCSKIIYSVVCPYCTGRSVAAE